MTIEQCEQRNAQVVDAWRKWKKGNAELDNLDCAIIAEILCIPYPIACQKYLIASHNKNSITTTAPNHKALETIYKFLDKLATGAINLETEKYYNSLLTR